MGLRSNIYYDAALERIEEARLLHNNGYYALAMYVSGLAVECLLRAFRLLKDQTFDERHDLLLLWKNTDLADMHSEFYEKEIHTSLLLVALLWQNDYRFRSKAELRAHLKRTGQARGIKGDFLKFNSKKLLDVATQIIRLGGKRWELLKKR
jgi:hypothetical protein